MRPTTRLWETFAVAALVGMASNVCLAAEEARDPDKPLQASGVIASVDALGGILTLKESSRLDPATGTIAQPTNFLVDAKTVISKDQQPLKLADVQAGDTVTVEYATKDGGNVASSITIQSPVVAKPETVAVSPSATSSATSSKQ